MRLHRRSVLAAVVSCCLMLIFGLSGCRAATDFGAHGERPEIGFLPQNSHLSFGRELGDGFRLGAQVAGGVDVVVTGPPVSDGLQQLQLFKELTATAEDGVAVAASAPSLLAPPMATAAEGGVPLVAVDTKPAPGSGARLYAGNDSYELGQLLADEAIKRLPPNTTAKIVLGTHTPGLGQLDQRARGMHDQFFKKLPTARVVGPFDTHRDPDPEPNLASWRRLVTANPDAVAFLGTGDVDAFNLAKVRADTKGTWLAGGCGVDPRNLQGIKEGQLFASVSPEHYLKGAVAGWFLAAHANGTRELPEGWLVTPGQVITSDNVDLIMRRQQSEAAKLAWYKPQLEQIIRDPARFLRPLEQVR